MTEADWRALEKHSSWLALAPEVVQDLAKMSYIAFLWAQYLSVINSKIVYIFASYKFLKVYVPVLVNGFHRSLKTSDQSHLAWTIASSFEDVWVWLNTLVTPDP